MKRIIILTLIAVMLSSCEDFFEISVPIDVDPHENKIAPTALLGNPYSLSSDEVVNSIFLSRSKGALDNSNTPLYINQATITLSTNEVLLSYTEDENHPGNYLPDDTITFIPGLEYQLTVEKNGFKTVKSTQKFPSQTTIISATYDNNLLKVKFQDTDNQKDYYAIEMYRITPSGVSLCYLKPFGSSAISSSISHHQLIFNDETFDGELHEFIGKFETYDNGSSDNYPYFVLLHHISEDYYRFDKTLGENDSAEENPFAEPVIMYTNIENGYGIFGLRNTSEFVINR